MPLRVLIVEDQPADAALLLDELRTAGFDPVAECVDSESEYIAQLGSKPDVILCDYHLPQFHAIRALELLRVQGLDVPLIIVSGSIGEEVAVACMQRGASDYLLKDRLGRLGQAVEQALQRKRSEAVRSRLAAMVENSDDAIIGMTLDGVVTSWNQGAERIYGYRTEEAMGKPITFLVPPSRLNEIADITEQIRRGNHVDHFETSRLRKDGTEIDISMSISPLGDALGRLIGSFTIARDITDRIRTEEQLAFLAYHDRLTGLVNRARFEEELEAALARARRHGRAVGVVYLDLDNFKLVNDALGHRAGDELLREISGRIASAARGTDVVARHGGDEFLILLPDLEPEGTEETNDPMSAALAVADRIHQLLAAPVVLTDTDLYVSASVGISVFPTTAPDATGLLANADAAMYRSKERGPGRTVVAPPRGADSMNRLSLATSLRKAAEEDRWLLRYQPIVDISTGKLVGVEALVRLRGPDGEELLPGTFLPIAQEIGLMEQLGDWVVAEACRQAREWQDVGRSLLMTVNLSPPELRRRDVLRVIVGEVEAAGLDPSSLVIEVTESAAMMGGDGAKTILEGFHDHGLRVAIDDFGTGYSSLSRLKQLPAHILKIDRSFLSGVPEDPDAASVVTAIIELARTLGMIPLAEGVETVEQKTFLQRRRCTLGQGWLFGRPLAPEQVTALWDLASERAGGRPGGFLRPVEPDAPSGPTVGEPERPRSALVR